VRYYDRAVELTLARPQDGQFFKTQPNAIVVRDLRVQFSIEKNLSSEPNPCTVTITNLAESTRAEIQKKPLHVRLDAGYVNQLERIFTGDMRYGENKREGVDWNTMLQLGDGDRAFRYGRVSRSFKSGVDVKTMLTETASSMGLKLPSSVADARDMLDQFATGVTLNGPSHREMDRILSRSGRTWSIQDGQLQILKKNEALKSQAFVLSQEIIGSPELGAPKEPGSPPVLSIKVLLHPGIRPGCKIQVKSRFINGLFRVMRVVHNGDTRGDAWFSEIEATPI